MATRETLEIVGGSWPTMKRVLGPPDRAGTLTAWMSNDLGIVLKKELRDAEGLQRRYYAVFLKRRDVPSPQIPAYGE